MVSLVKYLKPYRLSVVFVLVLTLSSIVLELFLPTLMADVVDIGIVNKNIPYILKIGGWMVVFSVFSIILKVISGYFASKVALGFGRDVRRLLFLKVEHFSLDHFENIGTASLITRTTNDMKQLQDVLNMMLRMMTRAPLTLIGGIILAFTREASLSLIFLASLPILVGLIYLITKQAIPLFSLLQKRTDRLNLLLKEALAGTRVIRAFNRTGHEQNKFNQANDAYRDTGIKVNKIMASLFPVMSIVMNFTMIAIVWFGAILINAGDMQVGNLMAFLQYAMMILMSLVMLSMGFIMIPRAQASALRINEVVMMSPSIEDPEPAQKKLESSRDVSFQNVSFRYAGAEKAALEQISFQANPGETTAIIGSTGAGKTTIAKLLLRFYDVESGAIFMNGVDIRHLTQETLRGKIGYVPQTASLFSGTIAENLRIGKQDATDDEIWRVLELSQALDFVKNKEKGIHTKLEQAGANLSGGQKQRLSIARALLRKPDIYIFDDSFSALDYQTDAKLRTALKQELTQATLIFVAQRVSTVLDADQIIVLDEGKIVGVGRHQQLLEQNQVYREIVSSQQTGEVLE